MLTPAPCLSAAQGAWRLVRKRGAGSLVVLDAPAALALSGVHMHVVEAPGGANHQPLENVMFGAYACAVPIGGAGSLPVSAQGTAQGA